jgi:hypothetical protein
MFKRYNARPTKPVNWDPHYLDHQTEGSKAGALRLNVESAERRKGDSFTSELRESEFWMSVFVKLIWRAGVVPGVWAWIFKPVLKFLFRGLVAPCLLFMCFLLWLII